MPETWELKLKEAESKILDLKVHGMKLIVLIVILECLIEAIRALASRGHEDPK